MQLTSMFLPALVTAVVAFAVLALFLRRRSAVRSRATDLAVDDDQHDHADPVVEPQDEEDGSPTARVLKLHVRVLEATLAEQDDRLHAAARLTDRLLEQAQLRHDERVQCVLMALRDIIGDQPGPEVINRLQTALSRLGRISGPARPLLTPEPSGSLLISFATPRDWAAVAPPSHAPVEPVPAFAEAEPDPAAPGTLDTLADLFDDATPSAPQRVLPIPAPPAPVAIRRRGRRGLRRSRVS